MKRIVYFVLLFPCLAVTVFAQADLQPAAIVRLTRSEPITVRQLRTEMEKLAWQELAQLARRVPPQAEVSRAALNSTMEQRRQVLDMMINERLVLQAAERDRITVSENDLNQQLQQLKTQMAQIIGHIPSDDEFALAVKNETGQDFPVFRETMRRQSIVQRYLTTKKEAVFRSVSEPTEAEILNLYNLSRADFVRPDTVRFSMVQIPYGPDAASRASARRLADNLAREIGTDPANFDAVVLRANTPNSGFEAAVGGFLPRNIQAQQVTGPQFMETAFNLRQGQVSGLIEGPQAYHFIKVTETYAQVNLGIDDVFDLASRMTVRQFIHGNMIQQRQQEAIARATQELIGELRTGNPFDIMENNLNW